jgi:hypothetical protein
MTILAGTRLFDLETEYLFSRQSRVRREIVGPVAEGFRVNVYTEGGRRNEPGATATSGTSTPCVDFQYGVPSLCA